MEELAYLLAGGPREQVAMMGGMAPLVEPIRRGTWREVEMEWGAVAPFAGHLVPWGHKSDASVGAG